MTKQADSWQQDENTDKRKTSGQSGRAVHTESREPECCTDTRQDADAQKQCSTNNTGKPGVDASQIVMGNRRKKSFP